MITRRSRRPAAVRLLPSVVTILALCAGLSAVKFALDDQLGTAVAMIGAAAILDALDGRIARLLDATSKIGAELDSLADAISFGVAPALVLYVTLLEGSQFGWIVALVYAQNGARDDLASLGGHMPLMRDEGPLPGGKGDHEGAPLGEGEADTVVAAPGGACTERADGWRVRR